MGGGNRHDYAYSVREKGLSPRGRGKRCGKSSRRLALRSIPAWAGETRVNVAQPLQKAVYPRVGGGNRPCVGVVASGGGLSPRGRGKQA